MFVLKVSNLAVIPAGPNVYIKGFKSCSYSSRTKMFVLKVSNLAVIPAGPKCLY